MEHSNKYFVPIIGANASPSAVEFSVVQSLNASTTGDINRTARRHPMVPSPDLSGDARIWLYFIIFLLSVVGNTLVITTLVQNKRMRTVTNVFLLNLSISDLLLAVFCMPFTLIPTLLKNFIFGKTMCILIRYLQGKLFLIKTYFLLSILLLFDLHKFYCLVCIIN